MKTKRYAFKWYRRHDGRKSDWLSIGADGVMHIGRAFREKLPKRIQIGFDPKQRTLAVMAGGEEGFSWPRSGAFLLDELPADLTGLGLKLPLSFRLSYDSEEECWLGKPYPRRTVQQGAKGGRQYDVEQVMAIYPNVIPDAVAQHGKTIPPEERRAFVTEAFCEAVRKYQSRYGDMGRYLVREVRACLARENKRYVAAYRDRSLDQPLGNGEDGFSLYDLLPGDDGDGLARAEDRIMWEQFRARLSQEEQDLILLLESGCPLDEVERCLRLEKVGIYRLGRKVREKWRAFSGEA